jgi:hypothetical protein
MLALAWLAAGGLLGYFLARRSVAFGLSVLLVGVAATSLLATRPERAAALTADSVGVVVLMGLAPVGCALGILLRARRRAQATDGGE